MLSKRRSNQNQTICNVIQECILLCNYELETVIENSETNSSSEKILLFL